MKTKLLKRMRNEAREVYWLEEHKNTSPRYIVNSLVSNIFCSDDFIEAVSMLEDQRRYYIQFLISKQRNEIKRKKFRIYD